MGGKRPKNAFRGAGGGFLDDTGLQRFSVLMVLFKDILESAPPSSMCNVLTRHCGLDLTVNQMPHLRRCCFD